MRNGIIAFASAVAVASLASIAPVHAKGTLTVALPSNINTLDPAKTKIGEEYIVDFLVYSGLTEIGPNGKAKPDLAESWTASPDQKTWTFKLRKGVKFQDGRELNSADVKATIQRIMDPATASTARVNFSIVSSIDTPDKYTVVFHLKIPYSGFADVLGDRQVRIIPKDKIDTLATKPDGTGPFEFVEYKPSDRIVLKKNPHYFIPGIPKLDKIIFRIMPETAARIAALRTGAVDLVWDLPPETINQLKSNPKIVIDSVPTSSWDGLIMNASKKPFTDVRVRRAIELALDKKALVQLCLFGHGSATHTMIPPSSAYFDHKIPFKVDIPQAKKLLAEAGYPNGFTVTLYVPSGRPTRVRLGVSAAEMLKAIGVNAQIEQVPWDKFIKEIEGKAAFFTDGFYSRPTLDTSIYPWYDSKGSWNSTLWHYSNPQMDKVLDAARAAKTDSERKKLYDEFQQIAVEQPAGVIPYVLNHTDAFRSNVEGFKANPMMWLDLRRTTVQ